MGAACVWVGAGAGVSSSSGSVTVVEESEPELSDSELSDSELCSESEFSIWKALQRRDLQTWQFVKMKQIFNKTWVWSVQPGKLWLQSITYFWHPTQWNHVASFALCIFLRTLLKGQKLGVCFIDMFLFISFKQRSRYDFLITRKKIFLLVFSLRAKSHNRFFVFSNLGDQLGVCGATRQDHLAWVGFTSHPHYYLLEVRYLWPYTNRFNTRLSHFGVKTFLNVKILVLFVKFELKKIKKSKSNHKN